MMNKIKNGRKNHWKYFLLLPVATLLLLTFSCADQNEAPEEVIAITATGEEEAYFIVEDMPLFDGGEASIEFRKFIAEHLKYPPEAAKEKISGRVYLQFAVSSEGEVEDVTVVKGVHPSLDQEAVRVVSSSPRWTPGKQDGKRVKVKFTFPINFVLDQE